MTDVSPNNAIGERILVVAPQPFYEDRGTPIAVAQVVTGLIELGYGIDILTYPVGRDIDWDNTRFIRCANPFRVRSVPIGFSIRKLVLDVSLTASLIRRLRRHRYIAIHAVEEMAFPAVLFARRLSTRVIYDMQSSLPAQLREYPPFGSKFVQRVLGYFEEWLIMRADLIACSTGLIDHVHKIDPTARVVEWVFAGERSEGRADAAENLRNELGIGDKQPVVMYTGNFHAYQGLSLLIDAIPEITLAEPDAIVVLVGETPGQGFRLPDQAERLQRDGQLKVLPQQPRERISSYLEIADVLVSPRIDGDNIPLKIFTYMAAHRPIVATDISAHRSLLSNGRGILVQATAPAMAAGILSLLQDPDNASAVADRARDYMLKHHGDDAFINLVRNVYLRGGGFGRRARGMVAPSSAAATAAADADRDNAAPKLDTFDRVSVVIPARNEQTRIAETVKSVRGQATAGRLIEILVVDDGSSDGTASEARAAGARVIAATEPGMQGNPAAARNLGARESVGDPIIFLDADCVVAEGWLDALLSSHTAGATVVGGSLALPAGLDAMARCDYYCGWYLIHPQARSGFVPHHPPPNISVRRDPFLESCGFSTSPPLDYTNEERFWQAELRNAGHGIYFEPRSVAYHFNRPGFVNLLTRNYRWGYTAIEAKSQTGSARAAWLYRYPWLLIPAAPVLAIAHTAFIIGCWLRVGVWEPLLMLPAILASRLAYVVGMVVGALRWIRERGTVAANARRRPRWR